jgi:hypothetical protein
MCESLGDFCRLNPASRRQQSNLLAAESDPTLTFQLMLGRVGFALGAENHMRETMEEFRLDWALLEQTRTRLIASREQLIKITAALR